MRRVGPDPAEGRSPLPDVEEVVAKYDGATARAARVLVVPEAWAGRFLLQGQGGTGGGRVLSGTQVESTRDGDASGYFRRLLQGQVDAYRLVYTARPHDAWWTPIDIHASTSREVWIFERKE